MQTSSNVSKSLKSKRFLDTENEDVFTFGYLQINGEMRSQLWDKVSAFIDTQVKFRKPKEPLPEKMEVVKPFISQVKLLADADTYLEDGELPGQRRVPYWNKSRYIRAESCYGERAISAIIKREKLNPMRNSLRQLLREYTISRDRCTMLEKMLLSRNQPR